MSLKAVFRLDEPQHPKDHTMASKTTLTTTVPAIKAPINKQETNQMFRSAHSPTCPMFCGKHMSLESGEESG
jgi:hypothetical protein